MFDDFQFILYWKEIDFINRTLWNRAYLPVLTHCKPYLKLKCYLKHFSFNWRQDLFYLFRFLCVSVQLFHLLYFQQRLKSISWVLHVKYRVQFTSFSFLSTISRISSTFKDLCLIPVYGSGNYTILSALCNLQIFSKRCVKLAENVKLHFDQLIQSLCENLQSEKWRVVRGMGHGSGFHKILWLGEFMERGAWS